MTQMSTTAEAVVSDVYSIVDRRIDYLNDFAQTYKNVLSASLNTIQNIRLVKPAAPNSLQAPTFTPPQDNKTALPETQFLPIEKQEFPDTPDLSLLATIDSLDEIEVPAPPDIMQITLPSEPQLNTVNMPTKPTVDTDIALPDAPDIALPDMPTLEKIALPVFEWTDIEEFSDIDAPNVSDIRLPTDKGIEWTAGKEKYSSPLSDRLENYFLDFLNSTNDFGAGVTVGTTGLPAAIENALFSRAKERQSDETKKAIDEAITVWASRGFTLPQGALAKTIEGIKSDDAKRAGDLNRDVFTEAAKIRIEQLRAVIQEGLSLEEQKRRMFSDMLSRLFEVAKWQADAEMRIFNAQTSLFNIRQEAYRLQFDIYKTKIEAKMAKLQAYKTAVDAQSAIGQFNQQLLQVYNTQTQAVMAHVDIYKAELQAASTKADIIKGKFDMFRAEIQAYAEQMGVNKNIVDLYDARVRAEIAKGSLSETQARNYASLVQGLSAKADLKIKDSQLKIERVKADLSGFNAKIELAKSKVSASVSQMQQQTAQYQAKVEAWKALQATNTANAEMQTRFADMAARTNIAYSQMQISRYQADMEAAKQEAAIALEAAKSAGQYSAQLAAGAMSAAHISASLSGSGSLSKSESENTSTSTSHSYNY